MVIFLIPFTKITVKLEGINLYLVHYRQHLSLISLPDEEDISFLYIFIMNKYIIASFPLYGCFEFKAMVSYIKYYNY